MKLEGEDLDCAYYVAHRFIGAQRAMNRPVPGTVLQWCRRVALAWELSADGHESDGETGELNQEELCDTAEAAHIMGVTERQARRLANDLDGRKVAGVWTFRRQAVVDYAEAKRDGRTRPAA